MKSRLPSGFFAVTSLFLGSTMLSVSAPSLQAQEEAKRKELMDDAAAFWIYDDIDAGYSIAETTGKPLLVSFRCVI